MSALFKKLNVLLKSTLRGEQQPPRAAARPGKLLDRELDALRERITSALNHENRIKAQLAQLEAEIQAFDQTADDALRANRQDEARAALEKLRAAKRRYGRLEDDLHQHEVLTQELIQSVRLLEGAAAEVTPDAPVVPERPMTDVLQQAREKIAALSELVSPKSDVPDALKEPEMPETQAIDDDLEQRRQRLSRR